jgi:hypothetical protein
MQTTPRISQQITMRTTWTAICLLAFAQFATGQIASPDANVDV